MLIKQCSFLIKFVHFLLDSKRTSTSWCKNGDNTPVCHFKLLARQISFSRYHGYPNCYILGPLVGGGVFQDNYYTLFTRLLLVFHIATLKGNSRIHQLSYQNCKNYNIKEVWLEMVPYDQGRQGVFFYFGTQCQETTHTACFRKHHFNILKNLPEIVLLKNGVKPKI